MPLVPTTNGARSTGALTAAPPPLAPRGAREHVATDDAVRRRSRQAAQRQQATERLAAATSEMAAQTAQSREAGHLLMRTMQELAAGAEQASAASQESVTVIDAMSDHIGVQRQATSRAREMAESLKQTVAVSGAQIAELVANVGAAAGRQRASVARISELEAQADEIGSILRTVAHIADETNLLALNAAIEAARARQHGKGFAVVADEVRALAETSERSAREIRELIDTVRAGVTAVAVGAQAASENAAAELAKGEAIGTDLLAINAGIDEVVLLSADIAGAAVQAESATTEIRRMIEEIAAAAEQQSAAVSESLQAIESQTESLNETEKATEEVAVTAEELQAGDSGSRSSSEELGAAAEELASAVEQIRQSANEIAVALREVAVGAQNQAANAHKAEAAIVQLEAGAQLAETGAISTQESIDALAARVAANKVDIDSMVDSIGTASTASRDSAVMVAELENASRRIDKIVDAIATVALQTNMLAVSGSVESARAGEFGRGFAVVSADIRSLAKDSAENAERIKDLVGGIQDRIVAVRAELTETAQLSLTEVLRARESGDRLVEIERDLAAIQRTSGEVRGASQQIAAGLAQIRQGMDDTAAAARQADVLTSQAATAASQQSTAADEIAIAIDEIASLAEELQSS